MAKHHTFRLNDLCSMVAKRGTLGPQQREHVVIVGRHLTLDEYTVYYANGLFGWVKADEMLFVQHDAWEQLEIWQDAYDARCRRTQEQDDAATQDSLSELSMKLDRIDAGHCSECDKKLDSDEGDDESMCLSCRCDEIGGVK